MEKIGWAELIGRIADIEGLEWIKLHYAYHRISVRIVNGDA